MSAIPDFSSWKPASIRRATAAALGDGDLAHAASASSIFLALIFE
jgi:hypothetical protein